MSDNNTQRLGDQLCRELKEIQKARHDAGLDAPKPIAIAKLTDLITKHNAWKIIKEEMKTYQFKDDE